MRYNLVMFPFLPPALFVSLRCHTHEWSLGTWHFPEKIPDSGTWGREYWLAEVLVLYEEHSV